MADEIDAGRIVAEIVLETKQAREEAEQISEELEALGKKSVVPQISIDDSRIQKSYDELRQMFNDSGKSNPVIITPTLDSTSYTETIEYIRETLERIGITGKKADKIISSCFQDVDNLKNYQNNLEIIADKIEMAQRHYQELAQAKNNAEKQNNFSDVNKLTSAMEKQANVIKTLEARFDTTYTQLDSAIEKTVQGYQKQTMSAAQAEKKQVAAAENAVKKQSELNQVLSNKQAKKDFAGGMNLAITSLRTFNSTAPDTIDGIGQIITQINAAKQAMTMGVSAGLAWGTAIVAGIGVVASLVANEIEKAQQAAEEARQKAVSAASEYEENAENLNDLREQFLSLRSKLDSVNLSRQEEIETKKELYQLQDEFIKKYGLEADAIDIVTGSIEAQTAAIEEQEKSEARRFLRKSGKDYNKYKEEMENEQEYTISFGWNTSTDNIDKLKELYAQSEKVKSILKSIPGAEINGEPVQGGYQHYTIKLYTDGKDAEKSIEKVQKQLDLIKVASPDAYNALYIAISDAQNKYIDDAYEQRREVYEQGRQAEEVLNGTAENTKKHYRNCKMR